MVPDEPDESSLRRCIKLFVGDVPDVPMLSCGPVAFASTSVGSDAVFAPSVAFCATAWPATDIGSKSAVNNLRIDASRYVHSDKAKEES